LGARDDVEHILPAFDAFALTSHTEGLPLVVLEAMATGLPVISTAVGGIPDIIQHGVTGLLTTPGSRASLTFQLSELATAPALGLQLGTAARQQVLRHHSVKRMAAEYEALYAHSHTTRNPVETSTAQFGE
jgi:glycosyltransferase involved in cell wall biosynthesis